MTDNDSPITPGAERGPHGAQWIMQDELPVVELADGIEARVISGERMMCCWISIDPDRDLPLHEHLHEQIGVVVEGDMRVTIGDETREVIAGEAYVIPPGVIHGAKAGRDGVQVMESFAPPRADYIVKAMEAVTGIEDNG